MVCAVYKFPFPRRRHLEIMHPARRPASVKRGRDRHRPVDLDPRQPESAPLAATGFTANTVFHPAAWRGHNNTNVPEPKTTRDDGTADFWAPPRGYVVYLPG
jgi:hypothetical protein